MAKNTRPFSGQMQRKYLRDLLKSDPGVTPDAVERLTEIISTEVASIRVRLPLVIRKKASPAVAAAVATAITKVAATEPVAKPTGAAFDPHAFSLIVVFRTGGKDALLAKLNEVTDPDQLKAIAKAQHVALDGNPADRTELLSALIAGTEKRIAHRQAAAS
jgi:hypothetical protein